MGSGILKVPVFLFLILALQLSVLEAVQFPIGAQFRTGLRPSPIFQAAQIPLCSMTAQQIYAESPAQLNSQLSQSSSSGLDCLSPSQTDALYTSQAVSTGQLSENSLDSIIGSNSVSTASQSAISSLLSGMSGQQIGGLGFASLSNMLSDMNGNTISGISSSALSNLFSNLVPAQIDGISTGSLSNIYSGMNAQQISSMPASAWENMFMGMAPQQIGGISTAAITNLANNLQGQQISQISAQAWGNLFANMLPVQIGGLSAPQIASIVGSMNPQTISNMPPQAWANLVTDMAPGTFSQIPTSTLITIIQSQQAPNAAEILSAIPSQYEGRLLGSMSPSQQSAIISIAELGTGQLTTQQLMAGLSGSSLDSLLSVATSEQLPGLVGDLTPQQLSTLNSQQIGLLMANLASSEGGFGSLPIGTIDLLISESQDYGNIGLILSSLPPGTLNGVLSSMPPGTLNEIFTNMPQQYMPQIAAGLAGSYSTGIVQELIPSSLNNLFGGIPSQEAANYMQTLIYQQTGQCNFLTSGGSGGSSIIGQTVVTAARPDAQMQLGSLISDPCSSANTYFPISQIESSLGSSAIGYILSYLPAGPLSSILSGMSQQQLYNTLTNVPGYSWSPIESNLEAGGLASAISLLPSSAITNVFKSIPPQQIMNLLNAATPAQEAQLFGGMTPELLGALAQQFPGPIGTVISKTPPSLVMNLVMGLPVSANGQLFAPLLNSITIPGVGSLGNLLTSIAGIPGISSALPGFSSFFGTSGAAAGAAGSAGSIFSQGSSGAFSGIGLVQGFLTSGYSAGCSPIYTNGGPLNAQAQGSTSGSSSSGGSSLISGGFGLGERPQSIQVKANPYSAPLDGSPSSAPANELSAEISKLSSTGISPQELNTLVNGYAQSSCSVGSNGRLSCQTIPLSSYINNLGGLGNLVGQSAGTSNPILQNPGLAGGSGTLFASQAGQTSIGGSGGSLSCWVCIAGNCNDYITVYTNFFNLKMPLKNVIVTQQGSVSVPGAVQGIANVIGSGSGSSSSGGNSLVSGGFGLGERPQPMQAAACPPGTTPTYAPGGGILCVSSASTAISTSSSTSSTTTISAAQAMGGSTGTNPASIASGSSLNGESSLPPQQVLNATDRFRYQITEYVQQQLSMTGLFGLLQGSVINGASALSSLQQVSPNTGLGSQLNVFGSAFGQSQQSQSFTFSPTNTVEGFNSQNAASFITCPQQPEANPKDQQYFYQGENFIAGDQCYGVDPLTQLSMPFTLITYLDMPTTITRYFTASSILTPFGEFFAAKVSPLIVKNPAISEANVLAYSPMVNNNISSTYSTQSYIFNPPSAYSQHAIITWSSDFVNFNNVMPDAHSQVQEQGFYVVPTPVGLCYFSYTYTENTTLDSISNNYIPYNELISPGFTFNNKVNGKTIPVPIPPDINTFDANVLPYMLLYYNLPAPSIDPMNPNANTLSGSYEIYSPYHYYTPQNSIDMFPINSTGVFLAGSRSGKDLVSYAGSSMSANMLNPVPVWLLKGTTAPATSIPNQISPTTPITTSSGTCPNQDFESQSSVTLTFQQVVACAQQAGFTGTGLEKIVSIADAESSFHPGRTQYQGDGCVYPPSPNTNCGRGILQIDSGENSQVTNAEAYNPFYSFQWAYTESGGGNNFDAWCTYELPACSNAGNNAFCKYMPTTYSDQYCTGGGLLPWNTVGVVATTGAGTSIPTPGVPLAPSIQRGINSIQSQASSSTSATSANQATSASRLPQIQQNAGPQPYSSEPTSNGCYITNIPNVQGASINPSDGSETGCIPLSSVFTSPSSCSPSSECIAVDTSCTTSSKTPGRIIQCIPKVQVSATFDPGTLSYACCNNNGKVVPSPNNGNSKTCGLGETTPKLGAQLVGSFEYHILYCGSSAPPITPGIIAPLKIFFNKQSGTNIVSMIIPSVSQTISQILKNPISITSSPNGYVYVLYSDGASTPNYYIGIFKIAPVGDYNLTNLPPSTVLPGGQAASIPGISGSIGSIGSIIGAISGLGGLIGSGSSSSGGSSLISGGFGLGERPQPMQSLTAGIVDLTSSSTSSTTTISPTQNIVNAGGGTSLPSSTASPQQQNAVSGSAQQTSGSLPGAGEYFPGISCTGDASSCDSQLNTKWNALWSNYWGSSIPMQGNTLYFVKSLSLSPVASKLSTIQMFNGLLSLSSKAYDCISCVFTPLNISTDNNGDIFITGEASSQPAFSVARALDLLQNVKLQNVVLAEVQNPESNAPTLTASFPLADAYASANPMLEQNSALHDIIINNMLTFGPFPEIAVSPTGREVFLGSPNYGFLLTMQGNSYSSSTPAQQAADQAAPNLIFQGTIPLSYSKYTQNGNVNINIEQWLLSNDLYGGGDPSLGFYNTLKGYLTSLPDINNVYDQVYYHHPLGIEDINGYLYLLDDWMGNVGGQCAEPSSINPGSNSPLKELYLAIYNEITVNFLSNCKGGVNFNVLELRVLNSTGQDVPISGSQDNNLVSASACSIVNNGQLQIINGVPQSSTACGTPDVSSISCGLQNGGKLQVNNGVGNGACLTQVSICDPLTQSYMISCIQNTAPAAASASLYTNLISSSTSTSPIYPPYGWVLSANFTEQGKTGSSVSFCGLQGKEGCGWPSSIYNGGFTPIGPQISSGSGTLPSGVSFSINYNNTLTLLWPEQGNMPGELLFAHFNVENYTKVNSGNGPYKAYFFGGSSSSTPSEFLSSACGTGELGKGGGSVLIVTPNSNGESQSGYGEYIGSSCSLSEADISSLYSSLSDMQAPVYAVTDPFAEIEKQGTFADILDYFGSFYSSFSGSGSTQKSLPSSANCNINSNAQSLVNSGSNGNSNCPPADIAAQISSAQSSASSEEGFPQVALSSRIGGTVLVPYQYTYTITQKVSNVKSLGDLLSGSPTLAEKPNAQQEPYLPERSVQQQQLAGECQIAGQVISALNGIYTPTQTQTVYSYATSDYFSSPEFTAPVEGGSTYLKYVNFNNNYYVPNLTDVGLTLPSQILYNIETDRNISSIYVNVTPYAQSPSSGASNPPSASSQQSQQNVQPISGNSQGSGNGGSSASTGPSCPWWHFGFFCKSATQQSRPQKLQIQEKPAGIGKQNSLQPNGSEYSNALASGGQGKQLHNAQTEPNLTQSVSANQTKYASRLPQIQQNAGPQPYSSGPTSNGCYLTKVPSGIAVSISDGSKTACIASVSGIGVTTSFSCSLGCSPQALQSACTINGHSGTVVQCVASNPVPAYLYKGALYCCSDGNVVKSPDGGTSATCAPYGETAAHASSSGLSPGQTYVGGEPSSSAFPPSCASAQNNAALTNNAVHANSAAATSPNPSPNIFQSPLPSGLIGDTGAPQPGGYEIIKTVPITQEYGKNAYQDISGKIANYASANTGFNLQTSNTIVNFVNLFSFYKELPLLENFSSFLNSTTYSTSGGYSANLLGYNRILYVYKDRFNNTIVMPLDADFANLTVINMSVTPNVDPNNANQTSISVTGTVGYYPFFGLVPFKPLRQGNIYIYYDANLNYAQPPVSAAVQDQEQIYNGYLTCCTGNGGFFSVPKNKFSSCSAAIPGSTLTNLIDAQGYCCPGECIGSAGQQPLTVAQEQQCTFSMCLNPQYVPAGEAEQSSQPYSVSSLSSICSSVGQLPGISQCTLANPTYTGLEAGAGTVTYHPSTDPSGSCYAGANSLFYAPAPNCNIYGSYGLPETCGARTIGNNQYSQFCVPFSENGNGICTSQIGLVGNVVTNNLGQFSLSFTACGTGEANLIAKYYGYPGGQPIRVQQYLLGYSANPLPPTSTAFAYGSASTSNELSYFWAPNETSSNVEIGLFELSYGDMSVAVFLASIASAILLASFIGIKSRKKRRGHHRGMI